LNASYAQKAQLYTGSGVLATPRSSGVARNPVRSGHKISIWRSIRRDVAKRSRFGKAINRFNANSTYLDYSCGIHPTTISSMTSAIATPAMTWNSVSHSRKRDCIRKRPDNAVKVLQGRGFHIG
jgi:hypothetical protein